MTNVWFRVSVVLVCLAVMTSMLTSANATSLVLEHGLSSSSAQLEHEGPLQFAFTSSTHQRDPGYCVTPIQRYVYIGTFVIEALMYCRR